MFQTPAKCSHARPRPPLGLALVIALTASALVIVFFSPPVIFWRSWYRVPGYFYGPAVGRGAAVVWQQTHLGSEIPDKIHGIIRWRVAVPGIAWLFRLPAEVHLALYPLGAIVAAWYAAGILISTNASWKVALATGVAFVANDWFFTSTRWLGYGDGWVVFGLLVVAFSNSWWLLLLVGIIVPWVDDRFLMAFPLTLATRFLVQRAAHPQPEPRGYFQDAWVLASALIGPGLAVILRILLESFPETRSTQRIDFPPIGGHEWDYVRGAWAAWRFAWLALPACWVSLWPACRQIGFPSVILAGYVALTFLSLAAAMFTAFDTSRAGILVAPEILVGLRFLAMTIGPRLGLSHCVIAIALANLVLPTSHAIVTLPDPIRSLPMELSMLRNPPPPYDARSHVTSSLAFASEGDWRMAANALAVAERLQPDHDAVLAAKAFLMAVQANSDTAMRFLLQRCSTADRLLFVGERVQELLVGVGESEAASAIETSLRNLADESRATATTSERSP